MEIHGTTLSFQRWERFKLKDRKGETGFSTFTLLNFLVWSFISRHLSILPSSSAAFLCSNCRDGSLELVEQLRDTLNVWLKEGGGRPSVSGFKRWPWLLMTLIMLTGLMTALSVCGLGECVCVCVFVDELVCESKIIRAASTNDQTLWREPPGEGSTPACSLADLTSAWFKCFWSQFQGFFLF